MSLNPQTHNCSRLSVNGLDSTMLRRILRSLPHSSQASNKFSSVFRQRTFVAPLRPSLYIFLGVSAVTFVTVIAIHGDSAQAPEDNSIQIRKSPAHKYLFPKKVPPSPTTDETFDLSSGSREKAAGISRVDTILLARCVREQCPCDIYFV